MKIWFDILTPKEILFFTPMARRLAKTHAVVCTGRRYRELESLAKIYDIDLRIVGRHGGGDRAEKLRASASRVARLQRFVEEEHGGNVDIAVSFCSPEAARVSYGLGINHIAFFDSPHIIPQMRLAVPLVQRMIIPSYIPKSAFVRYGIGADRIMTYKAIDAAYIISQHASPISGGTVPFSRYNKDGDKNGSLCKIILFRMAEEQSAYVGSNNMRQILGALADQLDNARIVVLARYADQIRDLQKEFGDRVTILTKSYDGRALLENVDLFVGSGGTMTSESALLGVPTMSTNAVPNWGEQLLVRKGVLHRASDPDTAVRLAKRMLGAPRSVYATKATKFVRSMEDPYPVLRKAIASLG